MKTIPFGVLALSLILGLATPPVDAAGGRVPIYQVPATIDTPGSYYVSRDLTGSSGAALITIASDDVTLDLAGHTVRRTDAGGDVIASSGNPTNIEIRNGRIVGGSKGIYLWNVAGSSFDVVLSRLTISDTSDDGVHVEGGYEVGVPTSVRIEGLSVFDAGGRGIAVSWAHNGVIRNNVVRNASLDGIVVEGSAGVAVADNNSSRNGDDGIEILGSTATSVDSNHLSFNQGSGLYYSGPQLGLDDRNLYAGNRMPSNGAGPVGFGGSSYNADSVGDNNFPQP